MLLVNKGLTFLVGMFWTLANGCAWASEDTALRYVPDQEFSAMSRRGNPKDINRGGGKRGCFGLRKAREDDRLQALVPVDGGGVSGVSRPKFWVYSPYVSAVPLRGILAVRRSNDFKAVPLQKVAVVLPSQPGMVGMSLPLPLEDRGLLVWSLTVVCDEVNGARNPFVEGLVLMRPNSGSLQKSGVGEFARSGYWYDALAAAGGDAGRRKLLETAGIKLVR
jgi:Domain of Unknown Function (DUF928)